MNHLDLWVRRGVPGHKFPLPVILGCDGSGVVEAVGELVTEVKPGDRVAVSPGFVPRFSPEALAGEHNLAHDYGIFGETRDGTAADWIAVPARNLLPMPASMSFEDAAALPLAALTAHHMLMERARIRPGMDVVIWAAGSGVSVYAIQIAKLAGARVTAIASSATKCARAKALGADVVVDRSSEDPASVVRELTRRRGADVVIDHVGEATFTTSLKMLARGGAVVTCGATSGAKLEADLRLIFFKSLSILGSTMGGMGEMRRVWDMACRGALRPVLERTFPLTEAASAHAQLEERKVFGKLVLMLGD
jgi:NADPH:quinone reductase-like Zn-dependent oxidoreductase